MRALYSLVCRLRTLCALAQGIVTLVFDGWAALAPSQWLLLGCGLGIVLRVLIPSPPPACASSLTWMDRLLGILAAISILVLAAADVAGSCASVGRLVLGS